MRMIPTTDRQQSAPRKPRPPRRPRRAASITISPVPVDAQAAAGTSNAIVTPANVAVNHFLITEVMSAMCPMLTDVRNE